VLSARAPAPRLERGLHRVAGKRLAAHWDLGTEEESPRDRWNVITVSEYGRSRPNNLYQKYMLYMLSRGRPD